MKVQVTSEIGELRGVIVHTPGPELFAVTPRTREDFLYDDLIEADTARREHQRLIAILERFTKVRSEEHTSELQSRRDLVCRLLLEKKKKKNLKKATNDYTVV